MSSHHVGREVGCPSREPGYADGHLCVLRYGHFPPAHYNDETGTVWEDSTEIAALRRRLAKLQSNWIPS